MPSSIANGSKEHHNKFDALSLQLSRASTLVDHHPDTVPHVHFEGREFYDPHATWTPEEESKVKRKTDIRLLAWLSLMYFAAQLDTTNMSNALADNFLHDLGFTMTEYGNGTMIHRICWLIAGLPSQTIAMRYGYRFIYPGLMCAWGAVAWTQAWIQSEAGFYLCRALTGLLGGAFGPLTVMCLSNFYTNKELGFRIAILASGINVAKALSSLLAAGLLNMRGVAGKPGWFWLILINGLLIFMIGLVGLFYLPSGPTRTQTVLWRKPWFSKREQSKLYVMSEVQGVLMLKVIMVNRLLRDDISKGRIGTKTHISMRDIWNTLKDPEPYRPVSCAQPEATRLFEIQEQRFDDTFGPASRCYCTHSYKKHMIPTCIEIPLFMTLLLLPSHGYAWARFAISTLIIGAPSAHPLMVSWISCNSFDPKKRGIAVALFGTIQELGSAVAAQIYREQDKPYYYTGNKVLISICAAAIVVILTHRGVLRYLNRKKRRAWEDMSEVEQRDYDRTKGHRIGNKTLTFAFSY
ncbi:unnamed protein product, partial [Aureobasidium uvarum]